jgi:hypothetical protein
MSSVSIKAVCALVIIVAAIAAPVAWLLDHPTGVTWAIRIGAPVLALFAVAVILKLNARADLAPDYLRQYCRTFFNRDGFCFSIAISAIDRIAFMEAYFQNQYDKPSIGRIAVRPARGFWMGRANIEWITYEIECAPGAFGVARIAIPIPRNLQGKRQTFEIGASVKYPAGKGRRLRFDDGVFLRTDATFGDTFATALTIAGAAGGAIVFTKPAIANINVPTEVAETLPAVFEPQLEVIWKLGDPLLQNVT